MTKAIFFDIDGTLLSYNTHRVLQSTIDAFEALRRKGIKTVISSGRPMILIPQMPVSFDAYITVNGGYCFVGDKILVNNAIDNIDCIRWLEYVKHHDLTTMCFTKNDMFINRIDKTAQALRDQLGFEMPPLRPLEEMNGQEVYQFIAIQPAEKDAETLQFLNHCRMPRWHPVFTDVIPDNSSKAVGIQAIINHFNITREETMAFGDGANDIEMLDYAGTGIAMGNAADIVKTHSDYVTDTSDNDGIAKALMHYGII
ncbi:MAG: Cof-type HAD-IIB family hydrolase [Bacteroidales bacterium]|nr:Cof-type HAD-IIB family hydrolase [Bacteroidales bacterium]